MIIIDKDLDDIPNGTVELEQNHKLTFIQH